MKKDNLNLHTDIKDEALDRLLADAKVEFDEAWLKEAESHIPAGFDLRLQATLDRLAQQDTPTISAEQPAIEPAQEAPTQPPRLTTHRIWWRIAACTVLLLGIGMGWQLSTQEEVFVDTCSTPEEAEMHLERALVMLNMNGKRAVKQAKKSLRETNEIQNRAQNKFITFE